MDCDLIWNAYSTYVLWLTNVNLAVDGKQARRLGLSGPLGELFDHGMQLNCTLTGNENCINRIT
jgi:hypothetical protein